MHHRTDKALTLQKPPGCCHRHLAWSALVQSSWPSGTLETIRSHLQRANEDHQATVKLPRHRFSKPTATHCQKWRAGDPKCGADLVGRPVSLCTNASTMTNGLELTDLDQVSPNKQRPATFTSSNFSSFPLSLPYHGLFSLFRSSSVRRISHLFVPRFQITPLSNLATTWSPYSYTEVCPRYSSFAASSC